MKCSVFRSSKKAFTYVYLAESMDVEDLPLSLRKVFGEPQYVLDLDLTKDRKLAYEDVRQVMQNLAEQGYHLQLPPKEDETGLLDLPEKEGTFL